jgi:hypothetical protein
MKHKPIGLYLLILLLAVQSLGGLIGVAIIILTLLPAKMRYFGWIARSDNGSGNNSNT